MTTPSQSQLIAGATELEAVMPSPTYTQAQREAKAAAVWAVMEDPGIAGGHGPDDD